MAEERLRRNLDRALDPGPDFPSHLWLSRTMAALERENPERSPGNRAPFGRTSSNWPLLTRRLAAVLAVIVLAVAATAGFIAIHRLVAPTPAPAGVPTTSPLPIGPSSDIDCSTNCVATHLTFVTAKLVWAVFDSSDGREVIYRSDDGGLHWLAEATWSGHDSLAAVNDMVSSADGKEALFVSADDPTRPTIFYTYDGGRRWTSFGVPRGVQVAPCVYLGCNGPFGVQSYFLNTREGWIVGSVPTSMGAQLYHTIDSGAHWSLLARIDPTNIDLMHGQLLFASSSIGWFVPDYTFTPEVAETVFRTIDGGRSWEPRTLEAPPGQSSPFLYPLQGMKLFNESEGVIELHDTTGCGGCGPNFVYTTSDGGSTWSARQLPSTGIVDFVDAHHWIVYDGGIERSDNGGVTWERISPTFSGVPRGAPVQVGLMSFVDPSDGYAVTCGRDLIVTHDGGANWALINLPFPQQLDCPF